MRVHTSRSNWLALCSALAVLTACAQQGGPQTAVAPPSSLGVMTQAEIAESKATTAYDAIERKHPIFLMSKIDLAPNAER